MPTVLRRGPYRIYFVSHDLNEPPHVHVDRDDQSAKFWFWRQSPWRVTWVSARSNCDAFRHSSPSTNRSYWRRGMSTSEGKAGERVKDVRFTDDILTVDLLDGRTISVPLVWYPRLLSASLEQRANWRVAGGGFGIHWPDVDEDLNTEGLLRGAPAPREPTTPVRRAPGNRAGGKGR